jgi:hypothetical protein
MCIQKSRFSLRWNPGVDQHRSTRNSGAVEACLSPVDASTRYRALLTGVDPCHGQAKAKIGHGSLMAAISY